MKERLANLHVHTRYSDGSFTPEEAVRHAKEKGLAAIAITDHDSINGLEEALRTGEEIGIEVIPGVEISAERENKEIHMLGYYIDYKDSTLLEFLRGIREDRKKRVYKMVEALNQHGLSISADDVLEYAGDVSISRLHIAQYMEAKGLVSSWREAFKKYIGDTKPCYVSSFTYTPKEVIEAIKNAGGIAVIAHPGFDGLDKIIPQLVEDGIEGIEAFHTEHNAETSRRYEEYAKEHNLLITGGSDCHGTLKGKVLMGTTTVTYSYVEALKRHAQYS